MKSQTVYFKNRPRIVAVSTIAGPKECEGIIGRYVEKALSDDMYGETTYEKAECKMLSTVIDGAISNAGLNRDEIGVIVSGDLLNQIISASFAARDFSVPFLGVYGACSTMAESLAVAATFIDGGYIKNAVAATGSHFASAERQYRYPLELGTTRPPQSQWTVTAAGAALVANKGDGIAITNATLGKVVDYGITDVNNMGAAMAPAVAIIEPWYLRRAEGALTQKRKGEESFRLSAAYSYIIVNVIKQNYAQTLAMQVVKWYTDYCQ